MAGLREIALASGVSMTAVSDILNRGRESRYRPETVVRVMAAIEELGYQPDRTAQSMRKGRTRMIGFVAPNLTAEGRLENGGVYPFLVGLSHGLTPFKYHAALVELEEVDLEKAGGGLPPVLKERFFDALILQHGVADTLILLAENVAVPILRWDSNVLPSANSLRRDEIAVTREMMDRLLALGHRRIGYMVGGQRWERYQAGLRVEHYSYGERFETYCASMREVNLEPMPIVDYEPDVLGRQFVALRPTAVIAPEADGARTAVDAALQQGWRVPQDLTVATLDREARVREIGRRIGGMNYDRLAVGRQAADMVREMVESGSTVPSYSSLFGEWVLGDTIAPPSRAD